MFKKSNIIDITVNGRRVQCSGRNISIQNGKISVDGKPLECDMTGDIHVVVNGDINQLTCAGSCTVSGDVNGSIDATGSVTCGTVYGDIDAAGSVRCRR